MTLTAGRLPQREGEIVISDQLALIGKVEYELGDPLELSLGKRIGQAEDGSTFELRWQAGYQEGERLEPVRKARYTVVGVMDPGGMERNWYGGYQAFTLLEPGPVSYTHLDLTALEYRLLLTLMHNAGQVMTRNQLLESIWDVAGNFVNDNTLTVYMKRLRDKLEEDPSNPKLIQTVRGMGYRMGEAHDS